MVPANKDDDEIRKHKPTIEEFQNAIVSYGTHLLKQLINLK